MSRITNAEMRAAFEAVREAHRRAGIVRTYTDYQAGLSEWNAAHPVQVAWINQMSRLLQRSGAEQASLEALVDQRQTWIAEHPVVTVMGADDMVFSEGSATYGNAWGIHYSPWHNPNSPHFHRDMSGHYEVSGISHLSTDRRTALDRMRGHVSGIYTVLNSDKADA